MGVTRASQEKGLLDTVSAGCSQSPAVTMAPHMVGTGAGQSSVPDGITGAAGCSFQLRLLFLTKGLRARVRGPGAGRWDTAGRLGERVSGSYRDTLRGHTCFQSLVSGASIFPPLICFVSFRFFTSKVCFRGLVDN